LKLESPVLNSFNLFTLDSALYTPLYVRSLNLLSARYNLDCVDVARLPNTSGLPTNESLILKLSTPLPKAKQLKKSVLTIAG